MPLPSDKRSAMCRGAVNIKAVTTTVMQVTTRCFRIILHEVDPNLSTGHRKIYPGPASRSIGFVPDSPGPPLSVDSYVRRCLDWGWEVMHMFVRWRCLVAKTRILHRAKPLRFVQMAGRFKRGSSVSIGLMWAQQ
jgi:hypothetical protein